MFFDKDQVFKILYFKEWFSGFIEAEGSFYIDTERPVFNICLIMHLIQNIKNYKLEIFDSLEYDFCIFFISLCIQKTVSFMHFL